MRRFLGRAIAGACIGLSTQGCIEVTAIEGDIQYWLEVGIEIPDTLLAGVEYPVTVTVQIVTVEVSPNGPEDWYEYQGTVLPDSAHVTVSFEAGTVDPASGTTRRDFTTRSSRMSLGVCSLESAFNACFSDGVSS